MKEVKSSGGSELQIIHQNMEAFKTHLEYIKKALEANKEEHKDITSKIDKFIDGAEKRFASKLTEKIVYGLASVMLFYLIVQIIES
jgi:hypothetical protein